MYEVCSDNDSLRSGRCWDNECIRPEIGLAKIKTKNNIYFVCVRASVCVFMHLFDNEEQQWERNGSK